MRSVWIFFDVIVGMRFLNVIVSGCEFVSCVWVWLILLILMLVLRFVVFLFGNCCFSSLCSSVDFLVLLGFVILICFFVFIWSEMGLSWKLFCWNMVEFSVEMMEFECGVELIVNLSCYFLCGFLIFLSCVIWFFI